MAINLNDLEAEFFERVRKGEAPFLGIFVDDFREDLRKNIKELLQKTKSHFHNYLLFLKRFPALFSIYLVIHLMEGFGEEGHFEVYRHLEKAIGAEIPPNKREKLWHHFRQACLQLGLSVSGRTSGPHFMVDEYLRQAGFPIKFIERLTIHMIKLAEDFNLPDDDDPEGIALWQKSLLERLNPPFSKIGREAIERDDQGYYIRLFVRMLNQPPSEDSTIQQYMRKALDQPIIKKQRFSIPQILLRDYQLGILLPGDQQQIWRVDIDGIITQIKPHDGNYFFILPSELPKKLTISGEKAEIKYNLWEDEADNRMLIFSHPTGKFQQGAALGQKEVFLKPGLYDILLRFEPQSIAQEIERVSTEPQIFFMHLEILPGEEVKLCRGPAQIILHAEEVPSLNWRGCAARDARDNEAYYSKDLFLEVVIPQELLELGGADYILTLKPGCLGEEFEVPLVNNQEGKSILNIDQYGQKWKPGVSRLLAELRRRDSQRVLARSSILWWNGLRNFTRSVLYCDRLPENLQQQLMENVRIDEANHQITFKDDLHRYFKLAFEDGSRSHSFAWPVPGIFLSLEEHGETSWERPIRLGSSLPVTPGTRNVLKVSTTEPATLELGSFQTHINFARVGSKHVPLASLIEYLGPGEDVLTLRYDGSKERIPLVRLSSPHEVLDFQMKIQGSNLEIKLAMQGEAEAFDLSAENLVTGEKLTQRFHDYEIEMGLLKEWPGGGKTAIYRKDINALSIQLNTFGWTPGWWVLDFQAKIRNKWGALIDAQGGIYVGELIINENNRIGTIADILGHVDELTGLEMEKYLRQAHRRLLPGYAKGCASFLGNLEKAWNHVFPRIKETISMETYMALLAEQSNFKRESSWVSYHHLGVAFLQIFGLTRDRYTGFQSPRNYTLVNCLQLLPQMVNPTEALATGLLHPAVAFGFANAALIMQGAQPKDFSLTRYQNALVSTDVQGERRFSFEEDWHPGRGDYLGPLHYRYAVCSLEELYLETLPGNEERAGRLITFLTRETNRLITRYAAGISPIDLGLLEATCKVFSEQEQTQRENIHKIIRFLSLWAYVCRKNAREPKLLEQIQRDINIHLHQPSDFKAFFSYLLYVGEDVFAFYLLLWELVFTCDLDI